MFFTLSKTINYFLQPIVILFILWGLSLLLRKVKWGKRIKIISIVLLLLFTNEFIANEIIGLYETPVTPLSSIHKTYDYGIVLTGVASSDKEIKDRVYVTSSPDRINHSVLLYKKGIIKKILISGGSGRLLDNSYCEAQELVSVYSLMGVDTSDILVEGESRNTYESAVAVKKMLANTTSPDKCLLITSGYHMPRSIACFKKQEWNCDTFSTDIRYHTRQYTPDVLLVPKVEAIGNWQTIMRECFGLVAYWFSGYV